MLHSHSKVAITTLEHLSKTQARQFAKALTRVNGLPWKILILIDSTLQHRASLHPENTKTFNHGKGYVIGHQWTNIVLLLGDMLIPLRPIPFYSKRYCQAHDLAYHSEHEQNALRADSWNLNLCLRGRLVGRLRHTCRV